MGRSYNMVYRLNAGNVWSPLVKYPRNNPCFCGSGMKHKKCCQPHVSPYLSAKEAASIQRNWEAILSGEHLIKLVDETSKSVNDETSDAQKSKED